MSARAHRAVARIATLLWMRGPTGSRQRRRLAGLRERFRERLSAIAQLADDRLTTKGGCAFG